LAGNVAIITGAATGIGKATARLFSAEGAKVVLGYNRSEGDALLLEKELTRKGGGAIAAKVDVSDSYDVKQFVRTAIQEFGRVDVWVNNAGIIFRKRFMDSTEEEWDKTIDTNLKGVYLCCKEVAPIMLRQKHGKIVNISSISGLAAPPTALMVPDYAASKAGIVGLTRALAVALAPHINVNAVCPGAIETDMIRTMTPTSLKARVAETLAGRLGKPQEIASAVLFLSTSESDYVTGEVLLVSGGRTMG
jgi:3-oxoacyl-[acyl-carrier protein] reductase